MTKEEFENLPPLQQGYYVYVFGENEEYPNIPNESNPYEEGTKDYVDWQEGETRAILEIQDILLGR